MAVNLSPILSPSGEPMFSVGGKTSFKTATHRGYVVSLEWIKLGKHVRAAMCIWPESNVFTQGDGGAWAITRNCISEFVGFSPDNTCTGGASAHCIREATEALTVMGKDRNDKQALLALVDTVIKFAPELVMMPATPKQVKKQLAGEAMWDVQATNKGSGKVLSEVSV